MVNKAALVFAFAAATLCSVTADALPLSPHPPESNVIQVLGGCGLGFHRSVYGYCVRNGYVAPPPVVVAPAPYYPAPVVVAPAPYYPAPVVRACPYSYRLDPYGRCVAW